MPGKQSSFDRGRKSVFLNIPYDRPFQRLYLAYIAGISALGLVPRATLEIPGSERRLDRILSLLEECRYSVHDLSRVSLDRTPPVTPRFNMPFELGLAVVWAKLARTRHDWFVCETKTHRVLKSLSDLNGTEVYIHAGSPRGVFRELGNAFVRRKQQPTILQMEAVYGEVTQNLPELKKRSGAASIFEARMFKDISVLASASADRIVLGAE